MLPIGSDGTFAAPLIPYLLSRIGSDGPEALSDNLKAENCL